MSSPERPQRARLRRLALCALVLSTASLGCWEQWSEEWFPQMKWQKAVQPFERVAWQDQVDPFMPPPGSVPVDAEPPVVGRYDPAANAIFNPTNPRDFRSLARGQTLYQTYCELCHGQTGLGDGPISATGVQSGPLGGVFPLVTAIGQSDGYIYNLIRGGGNLMPNYQRIPTEDRWHLVNYVRHLQRGGQP